MTSAEVSDEEIVWVLYQEITWKFATDKNRDVNLLPITWVKTKRKNGRERENMKRRRKLCEKGRKVEGRIVMMDGADKIKAHHADIILNIYTKYYQIKKCILKIGT